MYSYLETAHNSALLRLRQRIRQAEQPDNPALMSLWLDSEQQQLAELDTALRWQGYRAQFRLLLETYADELLPSHWRVLALDSLYRPLAELKRMGAGDRACEYRQLLAELHITSHYFQASVYWQQGDNPATSTRRDS